MDWAGGQANGSPIGMGWADGCVDACVANPVDDVANALPVGMDWADGRVDVNVANPKGNPDRDDWIMIKLSKPCDLLIISLAPVGSRFDFQMQY